jgi:serine/threonine-protein kinase
MAVMPITSAVDLVGLLRRHRLLEPEQLEQLPAVPAGAQGARALARELIGRDWITPYQINQLFQGRGAELVLGPYVLLERLGEGGMGQVFKARHVKLRRVVALKVIRPQRLAKEDAVRRFHREIRTAAQLSHPNIVMAYDADEANGTHFFAMEYVAGVDLASLVKAQGPLAVDLACDYARQAALGLQHAHERGMVHRDVKPHNLLLTRQGVVKVLDLGLARLTQPGEDKPSSVQTKTGVVMGTPDYIAPEQARDSRAADTRSDLYSLGCVLYQLLSGRVPFPTGSVTEKLLHHVMDEPTPLRELRRDVHSAVAAVVHKLMAKCPEDRFQTPSEAAAALAAAALRTTEPSALPPVPAVAGQTKAAGETTGGAAVPAADTVNSALDFRPTAEEVRALKAKGRRRRSRRRRWLLGVLTVVLLLGALVAALLARR